MFVQENHIQPEESVIRGLLMQVPILQGAQEQFYHVLAENLIYSAYEPDELIIKKGEMGDSMYLISSGAVRVMSEDEKQIITILVEGDIVGEMSLVFGEFRSASVYSHRFCELYRLDRQIFENVVKTYPEIFDRIKSLAGERKKVVDMRKAQAKQSLNQLKARVIAKKVSQMPIFADADEKIIKYLSESLKPMIFSGGRMVLKEGDEGEHLYLVIKGHLDVLKGEGEQEVDIIAEGDIFGEMALLYNKPRSASIRVKASGYCELYEMSKSTFNWLAKHSPQHVRAIRQLAEERKGRTAQFKAKSEDSSDLAKGSMSYTPQEVEVIKGALKEQKKCLEIYITLSEGLEIKSAPASHVIIALEKMGKMLKTNPPAAKIILNQIEQEIVFAFLTKNSIEQVFQDVTGIEGVDYIDIADVSAKFKPETSVTSPAAYDPNTFLNATKNSVKLKSMLKSLKIFANAEDAFLDLLSRQLKPMVFNRRDYVFRRGDPGDALYMIFRGQLAVLKSDDATELVTLKEGDIFGESALIFGEARNASVRSKALCELYKLPKLSFDKILKQFPDIYQNINKVANERKRVRKLRQSSQQKEASDKLKALIMARQIKKIELFKDADKNFFEAISKELKSIVFQRGKDIIKEGQIGHNMFLIIRGKVEVYKEGFSTTLSSGDIFGESALIYEEPRNASVRTLSFCELYSLERDVFLKIASNFPSVSYKIKELAKARLAEST